METKIGFKKVFRKLYDYSQTTGGDLGGQEGIDAFDPMLLQEASTIIKKNFKIFKVLDRPHLEVLMGLVAPEEITA